MSASAHTQRNAALMAWYCDEHRILPWRVSPEQPARDGSFGDPYGIWVSEVMLQQTRVETVIPYYERFMAAFPTVQALAQADPQVLLKAWEGLGYYSRARNLQGAAQRLGDVSFPHTQAAALQLPGVGPYIAGAVLSIAYGIPLPAVDGNLLRVLARWEADDRDIAQPETVQAFRVLATDMLPHSIALPGKTIPNPPGTWNQAMMELGARVCVPGAPKCTECPVARHCEAFRQNKQHTLPVKSKKQPPAEEQHTVIVATDGPHILMHKRTAGLLHGMWVFPFAEALSEWQPEMGEEQTLPDAVHTFTHKRWHMQGRLWVVKPCLPPVGHVWVPLAELSKYPIPAAMRVYKEWVDENLL